MEVVHDKIKTKLACKRTYYAALRTGFAIILIGMQLKQKWILAVGILVLLVNLLKSLKLNKQLKSDTLIFDDNEWYDWSDILLFGAFVLIVIQAHQNKPFGIVD